MAEKEIFQLLLHFQDTNERLAFFTHDPEDAKERGKRIAEAERKQGRKVEWVVIQTENVPESFIGKSFNVFGWAPDSPIE